VTDMQTLGLDVQEDTQKIDDALESLASDMLRIALFGAFSDGKTSVIAAWLGKIEADMKIDINESSDAIVSYRPEGLPYPCEIIDTPGLFGYMEKADTQVRFEQVTKDYISRAHLVLYVAEAINPLKDSHKEIVSWVLRDLGKLSSTLFVINKMDDATDLSEPELFRKQADIKKEALTQKLLRYIALQPEEKDALSIVCISADPYRRSLEYWFSNPDEYSKKSRIAELKKATYNILQNSVPAELANRTGISFLLDTVTKKLGIVRDGLKEWDVQSEQKKEAIQRIQKDIELGRTEVKKMSRDCFTTLNNLENSLLQKLRPLQADKILAFLEDEIGHVQPDKSADPHVQPDKSADPVVGGKLALKMKHIVEESFEQTAAITERVYVSIEAQLGASERFWEDMAKKGGSLGIKALGGVSKVDPKKVKEAIFAARDLLRKIGVKIKFPSWGPTKWAERITKLAGPAAAVLKTLMEAYALYDKYQQEEKLQKTKNDITVSIQNVFLPYYDILGDDKELFETFAPNLAEFEKIAGMLNEDLAHMKEIGKKLHEIQGALEQIQMAHT
jgi:GTPase SAR1 family protein